MPFKKASLIVISLIVPLILFACGGGSGSSVGSSGTGTVSVSLTDSTTDLYRAVYITVDGLQICANNDNPSNTGCNWRNLESPNGIPFPKTYNLLKLVNGVTEAIGIGEFSAGNYNQIRLLIGQFPELENNLLGEPHPEANYVILNDGNDTIKPLKIPSGFNTGLKLVHPFTVGDGEIKDLVLDFDACRSVVKAGNSGKYILKPTIKVIEPESKVDVYGNVTDDDDIDSLPISGALVSAQISDGFSASVVRSTITDTEGTDNDLNAGDYLLSLLSPGQTYNIVAYSTGKSPACSAFNYNDGYIGLPLDFILSDPIYGLGTVSGEVLVQGDIETDFPLVVSIYTELDCNHPEGEKYVELAEFTDTTYNVANKIFNYSVQLPIYDSNVTYYVVASAEGYIPDTGTATISDTIADDTVRRLILRPSE